MPSKNKTTVKAEPGKQELYIIREFDAPRELVFRAHTDPTLFVKWIGPHGYEMILKEFEPVNSASIVIFTKTRREMNMAFTAVSTKFQWND